MKKILLAAFGTIALLSSCTKDDNDTDSATPADYLKYGRWHVISYLDTTVTMASGTEETFYNDLHNAMGDCKKDDFVRFETNDSVYFNSGMSKCDEDEPQIKSSRWELLNNNTQLRMAEYGGYGIFDILELNENRLRLRYHYGDGTYHSSGVKIYSH